MGVSCNRKRALKILPVMQFEDGVSGLLFPNGHEDALVERLNAVARGRAFANHQLPATLVRDARNTHRIAAHIERLRKIFAEATALAGVPH